MCILLAVMLTDVVLLDVFNSMGMPTSTTVSLVFELLGGTFALSLIKVNNDATLAFEKNGFERSGLGAYRRIQKVDCIITDSDDEIEHGQHEQGK